MELPGGDHALIVAAAVLLSVMAAVMVCSATLENQTWDEGVHLATGYAYWRLGDFRINSEHPPLAKLLCAAPLLALDLRLPLEHESWRSGELPVFGAVFTYRNRISPDAMLLLGRLPAMVLTLLLGVAIAWWTRWQFGAAAALVALFLFALDPNFIAHGRYVTTDVCVTLFVFLSCAAWAGYLEHGGLKRLAAAGLMLGLALASKFSALFLAGVLPLLYLIHWLFKPARRPLRRFVLAHAALAVIAMAVVLAIYAPETVAAFRGGKSDPLASHVNPETVTGKLLGQAGHALDLPAHAWALGLDTLATHDYKGHPNYLLGEVSTSGRPLYFPVVLTVKTPAALLILLLLAAAAAVLALRRGGLRGVRAAPFAWVVVTAPPLAYFAIAMAGNINLGVRHLLPVYPFLIVLGSAVLAKWKRAWLALPLLAGLHVYEHVSVAPHYLAFFNTFSGGPARGIEYLGDSNLDWGQDWKKFARYMADHQIDKVLVSYFGTADLRYYGVAHRWLWSVQHEPEPKDLDAVVAISATILQGIYGERERYAWYRSRAPDARVGYSIYVYDLRKSRL